MFYNLGSLHDTVNKAVIKLREGLKTNVKDALDAATLSQTQAGSGELSQLASFCFEIDVYHVNVFD